MVSLDSIYSEFFKQGGKNSQDLLDLKTRCFKDLYNLVEELIGKFHEIYVSCTTYKQKTEKFEETFKQLDSVFS
jgi:hypothetical protein